MRKYRRSKVRYIGFVAAVILALAFIIDYATSEEYIPPGQRPITDSLLTTTYPKLYEAVYQRSAAELIPFLSHESGPIRKQAWRAMANTPTDSLAGLVKRVKRSSLEEAWFALSMHELSGDLLRELEQHWMQEPNRRKGISRVLGRQGDERSLNFLLEHRDEVTDSPYEYDFALAVGRLMTQYESGPDILYDVITRAFETNDPELTQAYLYGFYRGPARELSKAERDSLYQHWRLYGVGMDAGVDQYVAKILGQRVFYTTTLHYNSEGLLDRKVQLGVELARQLADLKLTDDHALAAKILLIHPNPLVVQQTAESLMGKLTKTDHLFSYMAQEMLDDERLSDGVWLQALETVAEVDKSLIDSHSKRLKQIRENQPYLLPQVLDVLQLNSTPKEFLDLVRATIAEGEPLSTQFVLQALADYWAGLPSNQKSEDLREEVRQSVFDALSQGDRGVAYMAQDVLAYKDLVGAQDFQRINRALSTFELPEDIEVYQAFGTLYREQFQQQAEPVIDSLAALEYAPLNRSLHQAGWDVEIPENKQPDFRPPDWKRLWQLGRAPVWVLETEKGIIKVQLDLLSAPATISAIDSLTRAGAYNGVPFHRVVPNFVIQGGDVERGDGFGGPNFTLPTEASSSGFRRGATGIASAGTDTEGSQYFFMHQWSPHLNGRYTLFGHVIEGLDVVDRILVGDRVEQVYWE